MLANCEMFDTDREIEGLVRALSSPAIYARYFDDIAILGRKGVRAVCGRRDRQDCAQVGCDPHRGRRIDAQAHRLERPVNIGAPDAAVPLLARNSFGRHGVAVRCGTPWQSTRNNHSAEPLGKGRVCGSALLFSFNRPIEPSIKYCN